MSSARKSNNSVLFVGMLTGRPAEEMPGSTGDLLPELLQLHERIRQAMRGVAQALWPAPPTPEGLGELAEKLKGGRRHFRLWKISARRQGAREAWAMVVEDIGLPTRPALRSL